MFLKWLRKGRRKVRARFLSSDFGLENCLRVYFWSCVRTHSLAVLHGEEMPSVPHRPALPTSVPQRPPNGAAR